MEESERVKERLALKAKFEEKGLADTEDALEALKEALAHTGSPPLGGGVLPSPTLHSWPTPSPSYEPLVKQVSLSEVEMEEIAERVFLKLRAYIAGEEQERRENE